MRRVTLTLSDQDHADASHVAARHGIPLATYARIVLLREVATSNWAEEASTDTPNAHRVLPTLPPPRSK